MNDLDLYLEVV